MGASQPDHWPVSQIEAQYASTSAQLTAAVAHGVPHRPADAGIHDRYLLVMDVPLVDRLDVPVDLIPMAQALAIGQDQRQDLAASQFAINAARQIVQEQIAAYYPSVSLDLNYYLHKETVPSNIEWAGIFSANVPIFTGGLLYQNLRTSWSQYRQAWLQESFTSRQVREQVQQGYENVISEARQLPDLRKEVAAAREALRQAQASQQVGESTYLDLITAQNQLLSAQLSLTTAEFNYKVFYLDFLRAMGLLARPESAMPILQPLHETIPPELLTPGPTTGPRLPTTAPATVPSALPPLPAMSQ